MLLLEPLPLLEELATPPSFLVVLEPLLEDELLLVEELLPELLLEDELVLLPASFFVPDDVEASTRSLSSSLPDSTAASSPPQAESESAAANT
jgi:hypothetical protein